MHPGNDRLGKDRCRSFNFFVKLKTLSLSRNDLFFKYQIIFIVYYRRYTTRSCVREIQRRGNGNEKRKKKNVQPRDGCTIEPRDNPGERKCFQARRGRDGDRCERTRTVVKFTEEIRDTHVEEGP